MFSKMIFVAAASIFATFARADEADRVMELPELGPLTSKHYSGYLTLDGSDSANRLAQFQGASSKTFHIHYHYVEALNAPETAPVLLWLNGGPGCSSLLGEWTELGPYMFTQFGHIVNNTYTWAQSANLLFLESPVGVGFSYATPNGIEGLQLDDDITSMLNYQSLRHFFAKFPQLRTTGRRLLLAGESYAGHYIPNLADRVLEYAIKAPSSDVEKHIGTMMNGFMVGNPCTGAPANNPTNDPDVDFCGIGTKDWTLAEFLKSHAYGFEYNGEGLAGHTTWADCVNNQVNCPEGMDPYDILAPVCSVGGGLLAKKVRDHVPHLTVDQVQEMSRLRVKPHTPLPGGDAMGPIRPYGPCGTNYMTIYLNRAEVKKALNVDTAIRWCACACAPLHYQWPKTKLGNPAGVMHYYRKFFADPTVKANWTIAMYSGDADSVVNFVQSQTVVENMAGRRIGAMKPWYYRDTYNSSTTQLGGWYQDFEHMQWSSVKGCGHMVPGYCPYQAYGLFESILNTGKAGMSPHLFKSPHLAPGLIPANECPNQ